MFFPTRSSALIVVLMTVCILLTVSQITEAGYRKPPFNGSIFGKRSGNSIGSFAFIFVKSLAVRDNKQTDIDNQELIWKINLFIISIDYDTNGKTLSAMCEIAIESCQSWFPQDKK